MVIEGFHGSLAETLHSIVEWFNIVNFVVLHEHLLAELSIWVFILFSNQSRDFIFGINHRLFGLSGRLFGFYFYLAIDWALNFDLSVD